MSYIAEAITAQWGEKCADFEPGCHTCLVWKEYEDLKGNASKMESPWEHEEIVERFAMAWASIDGRLDKFQRGKVDKAYEEENGSYLGYMAEAAELLKRAMSEKMPSVSPTP